MRIHSITSFEETSFQSPAIPADAKSRCQGVSLVEILVVVGLIAIMTGLVTVSYRPFWIGEQLRSASNELIQQLQLARMKSILENRSYRLGLERNLLRIYYAEKNRWQLGKNFQLDGSIRYHFPGNVNFSSRGFASPKTIHLTKDDHTTKVIININGRIRLE